MTTIDYVKVQVSDPLPPLPEERRWQLHMRTTVPGERIEVQVNGKNRADAIRRILRRAVFITGQIEVTSLDIVDVTR